MPGVGNWNSLFDTPVTAYYAWNQNLLLRVFVMIWTSHYVKSSNAVWRNRDCDFVRRI